MYYRTTRSLPINPVTGFGMFTKKELSPEDAEPRKVYVYDGTDGVSIQELRYVIAGRFNDNRRLLSDAFCYMYPYDFYQMFDPEDIAEDAGAWGDPEIRRFFYDYIYEGEKAILLTNGAIVFDKNLIKEK